MTTPLHSALDAERAVLGAMMASDNAVESVLEVVRPQDFSGPYVGIFQLLVERYQRGEPLDPISVADEIVRRGMHRRYDPTLIAELYGHAPLAGTAAHYARIVRDRAVWRDITAAGIQIKQLGESGSAQHYEPHDAVSEVQRIADGLAVQAPGSDQSIGALLTQLVPTIPEPKREVVVPTGIHELDDMLGGGFRPGQMIVVAARPGMGKSIFAFGVALRAAVRHNLSAVFFSLEMSSEELGQRALAALCRVHLSRIRTGDVSEAEMHAMALKAQDLMRAPLAVRDVPALSVPQLDAEIRRRVRRDGVRLAVVDYLQLMTFNPHLSSRQEQVAEGTRGLKQIGRHEKIPIVAVAQLNRGPETRTDKRPGLSDLRESGSIEQDADVVLLLHRDDYYDRMAPNQGEISIIVAKHRNGPTGEVKAAMQGGFSRIVNFA